jgi:hypothetical protein
MAVDGALGAFPLAGRLLHGDQAVLLQRLDDGVQRAVVELDALFLPRVRSVVEIS